MNPTLIPDLVCVAICSIATVIDLRTQRIPNWLTGTGVMLGLFLNFLLFGIHGGFDAGFEEGLLMSGLGGLALLIAFGLMGLAGFVGMGDVKLMAAVGALLRWPNALWALAYVTLCGGAVALGYALIRGELGQVLGNLLALVTRRSREEREIKMHHIPYGLAILLGAAWAVGRNYFPFFQIP